ncbi:MAG: hypothetical protein H6557_22170 [Lewinellaceae bacterium]|nr:hypothetical protein [Phaeodactylibacter sp.]MCB9039330.1 hypothetical protein [Lewinellaceae bacterium]
MTRETPEVDAIKNECLNLLIVYHTYRATISKISPKIGSRFDLHYSWVHLRVLENDIVMRLCRLDDDDKTNHSLREALRSVRHDIPQKEVKAIDKRLKKYRLLINPLKTKARNYFLAHMSKVAEEPHAPQRGLEKPIEEVVNIVDMIASTPVNYTLSVGSQEPKLNLRVELSNDKSPGEKY